MKTYVKMYLLTLLLAAAICGLSGCGQSNSDRTSPVRPPIPTTEETQSQKAYEEAQTYVGMTIEDFIAVYGDPLESEYAPSCIGAGEDGTHTFENYVVYTYKEESVETIRIISPRS